MKATGIVRRIDDLGRVVIPKEIRRTLRIREGDPLEIFVDREGEVILKKYSPIQELGSFAQEYADSLHESLKKPVLICDRDTFIAVAGESKKDFLSKNIANLVERVMDERKPLIKESFVALELRKDQPVINASYVMHPIISNGDPVGSVIVYSKEEKVTQQEITTVEIASNFLGRQMQ
ncbi:AbrB family transcriptional regulator, stage V sporulation protein T [Amphibacillus marinus]|uniref:AbrB family transcriptional regulator, stage V sporulation protein T n=1 Tax=Amphibacillus marinus TaxID=872970 RepID=A0A1H8TQ53_9BACI|nr:stage V sporulation protein T [Amphibacillus marinus]SEO93017.1 AbrB family transcriptional regulator, stage V sporulation protein T [Amphibacillus marinus]